MGFQPVPAGNAAMEGRCGPALLPTPQLREDLQHETLYPRRFFRLANRIVPNHRIGRPRRRRRFPVGRGQPLRCHPARLRSRRKSKVSGPGAAKLLGGCVQPRRQPVLDRRQRHRLLDALRRRWHKGGVAGQHPIAARSRHHSGNRLRERRPNEAAAEADARGTDGRRVEPHHQHHHRFPRPWDNPGQGGFVYLRYRGRDDIRLDRGPYPARQCGPRCR